MRVLLTEQPGLGYKWEFRVFHSWTKSKCNNRLIILGGEFLSLNLAEVGVQVYQGEIVNLGPMISLKHFLQMWAIIPSHVHGTLQLGECSVASRTRSVWGCCLLLGGEPIKIRARVKNYFRHIPGHSRGRAVRIQNFRGNLTLWATGMEGLCCCAANLLVFCQGCSGGNFLFDQYSELWFYIELVHRT